MHLLFSVIHQLLWLVDSETILCSLAIFLTYSNHHLQLRYVAFTNYDIPQNVARQQFFLLFVALNQNDYFL